MQPRAWLMLAAIAAIPLASAATYGEGSEVEVDAPVTLEGRVDTWLPSGTVGYVGSGTSQLGIFRLTGDEAHVKLLSVDQSCSLTSIPGSPSSPTPCSPHEEADERVLTDVSITVTKILSAYKVVATSDRAHADTSSFGDDGRILVTTVSGARLDTNPEGMHLSLADDAWTPDSDTNVVEPVYDAEAYSAELAVGTAAVLRATGGFEAFFQGLQLSVRGIDEDGKEYSETLDTRMPTDETEPLRALVVEVTGGEMQGSSAAPFLGFAPSDQRPISDIHSRASFQGATGTLVENGNEREASGEDIALTGPASITLTKITSEARMTYTMVDRLQLTNMEDLPTDEPIPPGALAAAGAVGAGGAGGLIALAYFWPRLKYAWTLAFLPMYTRIERDAVLEHEKRDELYELIRSTPGIHAHEIGEKAHIGWGTTVYHLKLLENHGLIVSKKSGRYKRFFVNTGEYTKKKDIYGALRNETAKNVAQYIVDHPGTTQKEMCAALGMQPSLASWHVEKLEGVELVKRVKDGRMVRYFAGPAWADLNVRVDPLDGGANAPAET